MGGIGSPKRIAHLGSSADGVPREGAEELTEFEAESVFVTLPGSQLLSEDRTIETGGDAERSFLYLQKLDESWVENTEVTVSVFTTPSKSAAGQSLNPLAYVDEESFVTEEGGQYLEQSGILGESGLGGGLAWLVTPEQVGSRSISFLGAETTLKGYVGLAEAGSGEVRTLLVQVTKTELDDEVALGAGILHRELWADASDDAAAAIVDRLSEQSVTELVGTDDDALIQKAGIAASADRVEPVLGAVSRS
jgi:hypothetical protein